MDLLHAAIDYIRAHPGEFKHELWVHLELCGTALAVALLVCVPLGVLASRSKIASLYALNAVGVARAIPNIAILFLAYPLLGLGFRPAALALIVLAAGAHHGVPLG